MAKPPTESRCGGAVCGRGVRGVVRLPRGEGAPLGVARQPRLPLLRRAGMDGAAPPESLQALDSPMAWLKPGAARRVLRGVDALVIQNWWQPANLWCAWLGRRRGIPYMMYAESTLQSRRFARGPLAWLRRLVFRNAGP